MPRGQGGYAPRGMLLAIDVGNTNTVLGVYDGHALRAHWRVETTAVEWADILASGDTGRRWINSPAR